MKFLFHSDSFFMAFKKPYDALFIIISKRKNEKKEKVKWEER